MPVLFSLKRYLPCSKRLTRQPPCSQCPSQQTTKRRPRGHPLHQPSSEPSGSPGLAQSKTAPHALSVKSIDHLTYVCLAYGWSTSSRSFPSPSITRDCIESRIANDTVPFSTARRCRCALVHTAVLLFDTMQWRGVPTAEEAATTAVVVAPPRRC